MDKLDFFGFLRAMYYTDVMTEDGVQWKLKSIVNSMPEGCEEYSVRVAFGYSRNQLALRACGEIVKMVMLAMAAILSGTPLV